MPSLQETVEQQAATIQQLTDIVAKSEARHRSLERMMRWMGVGVIVLAIMLVLPIKQDLFNVAHADTTSSTEQQTDTPIPTCGQLPQMPCDDVQAMVKQMSVEISMEIMKAMLQTLSPMVEKTVKKVVAEVSPVVGQVKHSPEYLNFMGRQIDKQIQKLEAQVEKLDKKQTGEKKFLENRIEELREIKDFGAHMTIMDHIANIDYDFDNLATIGHFIPQLIQDMSNMSNKMDNMSHRMDTMARDMHNMNSMAFDIHNMAATGVPVMGRMNNATSWMPWW